MLKASLLPRAGAFGAALVLPFAAADSACAAAAATATASGTTRNGGGPESTPVSLGGSGHASHVGSSGSIVRTIVGLAIVIGVIYGVAWVLKQVKKGRDGKATGGGLATVASVPLGNNRSVQLVRAGCELVLVGVAEQGVTPIRTYTIEQAQAAGLIDEDGDALAPLIEGGETGARPARPRLQLPRPRLALPSGLRAAVANATAAEPTADGTRATGARTATALTRPPRPAGANVLDTLRAWTVRQ
jgi:flagellar protein FliO/FliZ